MKGIILAGGVGSRLYPLTVVTSKQLLPVFNKPMIYYPLSTLMLAGIRDILIISTPKDSPRIKELLGNGEQFGINLKYAIQEKPEGLAQAFIIGKQFIENDACAMILGDNIFYGNGLGHKMADSVKDAENGFATIYGYYVEDPKRFGIMEFDNINYSNETHSVDVISVEEKPETPKSNYAIVGLYFYPKGVSELAEKVRPSNRGELEITTLNDMYLKKGKLKAQLLGRGFTWIDAGTFESLQDATDFVAMIEHHQGMIVSAPEELAYRLGWINDKQMIDNIEKYGNSPYALCLKAVFEGKVIG